MRGIKKLLLQLIRIISRRNAEVYSDEGVQVVQVI